MIFTRSIRISGLLVLVVGFSTWMTVAAAPPDAATPADSATQSIDAQGAGQPQFAEEPAAENGGILPVSNGGEPTPLAAILDTDSARISFQALLTDDLGDPLPGPTVTLDFQFYTAANAAVGAAINMPAVPIDNGVVDVLVPADASVFTGDARRLGVSVDGGAELSPRIDIGAVPYAFRVDRVASEELDDDITLGDAATNTAGSLTVMDDDGTSGALINGATGQFQAEFGYDAVDNIGGTVVGRLGAFSWGSWLQTWDENGDTTMRLGSSSSVGGFAEFYRATGGTSVFIDGDDGTGGGIVDVRDSSQTTTVLLDGSENTISTFGDDGLEQTRLWGPDWGELLLFDADGSNDRTVRLSARNLFDTGGELQLYDNDGAELGWYLSGGAAGGIGYVYNTNGDETIVFDGQSTGSGGAISVYNDTDDQTVVLTGDSSGGGRVDVRDSSETTTVSLNAAANQVSTYGDDGLEQVRIWGGSWGEVLLHDSSGSNDQTVRLAAQSIVDSGGELQLFRNDAAELGWYLSGGSAGGLGYVYNTAGDDTIVFDGQGTGNGGNIELHDGDGDRTVLLQAAESTTQGGAIKLYDATGSTVRIELDGDFNGEGRIITQVIQITGGADLSEQFDINGGHEALEPGMVVSIDPSRPGELVVSSSAYDRTVAGIISGAGGVQTGMLMGQRDSKADGAHPVALTGRVYCHADASNGAIQPGDLLTTSNVSGHCMKATDADRMQGAIIGKAMTSLESGRGLVLVLVSLQ